MAKLCSHCSASLWRDDAHFCSRCGGFQPHVQSSESTRAPVTQPIPRIEEASDRGETLFWDSKEELLAPQKVQESALLDADDGTPVKPFVPIFPLPRHNVSDGDKRQDSLALREEWVARRENVAREENAIPISENLVVISVIKDTGNIPVSEDPSIIPISEGPGHIPVSEGPGHIPVSEDPDLISAFDNGPGQSTRSSQDEVLLQDLTVGPQFSVPTGQEHIGLSDGASVQEMVQSDPVSPSSGPVRGRHSKFSLWLTVLLVALVIVGGVSWLLFLQLTPNTNPWQSFSDTKLGFSVSYPTDWQEQVDPKQSIIYFHDSTQTGKVDIVVSSSATASNVAQCLQQQASQLGLTNLTTGPSRSFAGAIWQQVQGEFSQEGVSYRVTMLATRHGNHFFLLTQSSPQSIYNDEETLIFSVMREGFRFLS